MMIFTKGEFVRIKEGKYVDNFGRVIKVSSLESNHPFSVQFFSGSKKIISSFEHHELELRNSFDDIEERRSYNIQAAMQSMHNKT